MAQETEEEDQSKKRKKWLENLSVLSSEDEEDTYTTTTLDNEKQSILENDKAIYLRFPYYMGSDNSDDDDGIKYFPTISPQKRDVKSLASSSDESNDDSKENHSYKHTKRKHKSKIGTKNRIQSSSSKQVSIDTSKNLYKDRGTLSRPEEKSSSDKKYKSNSKKLLNSSKSIKKSPVREKNKNSYSLKLKNDLPSVKNRIVEDVMEDSYENTQKDEESQLSNLNSSRFLDSSSESLNDEIVKTKTKRTKYRRVKVLSTDSSSSDHEDDQNKSAPRHNLDQPENSHFSEAQTNSSSKPKNKLKPSASLSSEEEDDNSLPLDPTKEKSESVSELEVSKALLTHSVGVTKPTVNESAWKSIAIADIKAQFNKQSKVEELKRKFAPSNQSSIAIYKKIQKRELQKNKSKTKRPSSTPKPLHNLNKTSSEVQLDNVPSTSASQRHDQCDNALRNQTVKISDSTEMCKSKLNLCVPEKTLSNTENFEESAENLHVPRLESQFNLDSSPLESDTKMSVYGKKIRQAHNSGQKNQNDTIKGIPQTKSSNQATKQKQSSKENKSKELKKMSEDNSESCDVLGNIMSQMDKNPFKIQKPTNKKPEPTSQVPGWFPAGVNASSSSVLTSNATGQQPMMGEIPLKLQMPMANSFNQNIPLNPSYNPLLSNVVSSSSPNITGIDRPNLKIKNQELSQANSKQSSKSNKSASVVVSPSSTVGKFVPFYSAPQEDYEGNGLQSQLKKNLSTITKSGLLKSSSEPKTDNQSNIRNNSQLSVDCNTSNSKPVEELSNNPSSQQPTVSQVVSNNILSKDIASAVTTSVNSSHLAQKNDKQLQKNKSNNGENNNLPSKLTKEHSNLSLPHPQSPSTLGFPRGNGSIVKEFKNKQLLNNSLNVNNNSSKGIRVRVCGTEYRLPIKASASLNREDGETSKKPSETCTMKQTTSSAVNCSSAVAHEGNVQKKYVKDVINEREEPSSKAVSSSSTSSSSSPNDTSSSTDDSSSESSDESGKPSSSESSSTGHSDSRANSPRSYVLKDSNNVEQSNQSLQTKGPQIYSRENSQEENVSPHLVQDSPNCCVVKTKKSLPIPDNKSIDVIILSSSSDSDSNNQMQDNEIDFQLADKVCEKIEESDKTIEQEEKLINSNFPLETETIKQNSSNVGKIRVKSLKELGVVQEASENENALEPTQSKNISQVQNKEGQSSQLESSSYVSQAQIKEGQSNQLESSSYVSQAQNKKRQSNKLKSSSYVSKAQNKEGQSSQLETSSSSNASVINKNFNRQVVINAPLDKNISHKVPRGTGEKQNHSNNALIKKSTKPITGTIFLPVVPIAVINPANSVRVRPMVSSSNTTNNKDNNSDPGNKNSSVASVPLQPIASGSAISSNPDASQNSANVATPCSSEDVEKLFFKLCDELFTEVVLFKIPKLADDLHLLIAYDMMTEERLKKIDQLISPETIASEKRRAEKEFADMIKIRGHSFVPLFMTIVQKINKDNLKTLFTAVYCRIVHQLERIDPVNRVYRFKIRKIIKCMLQKHSSRVSQDILSYLEADNEPNFILHFGFIEDLLRKYDNFLAERQSTEVQNKDIANETSTSPTGVEATENNTVTERINEVANSASSLSDTPSQSDCTSVNVTFQASGQNSNMNIKPPPPLIGNLDQVVWKKKS